MHHAIGISESGGGHAIRSEYARREAGKAVPLGATLTLARDRNSGYRFGSARRQVPRAGGSGDERTFTQQCVWTIPLQAQKGGSGGPGSEAKDRRNLSAQGVGILRCNSRF